jgi:hypothetical protein
VTWPHRRRKRRFVELRQNGIWLLHRQTASTQIRCRDRLLVTTFGTAAITGNNTVACFAGAFRSVARTRRANSRPASATSGCGFVKLTLTYLAFWLLARKPRITGLVRGSDRRRNASRSRKALPLRRRPSRAARSRIVRACVPLSVRFGTDAAMTPLWTADLVQ